jgi:hypothetical protein
MLDRTAAKNLAQTSLDRWPDVFGGWVVFDEVTIERSYGWVFFAATREFLKVRQTRFMVPGNSPLFVERATGLVHELPTDVPVEDTLEEYERSGQLPQLE